MNAQLSSNDLISLDDHMQGSLIMPAQPASLPLADVAGKAGALDCDSGLLSSAAGLVLLKDVEAQRGLYRALADVLTDPRAPRRINCSDQDLLPQRVFHIVAGSEDANESHA